MNLLPFKTLVKERCGLIFEGHGDEKLAQALRDRIAALAIQSSEYYARLHGSETEFQALVNLLTINETYFFREPEQIRLLVDRLAPRLLVAHGGMAPVRILSAGCSSGEEPYSLVMALMDKYGDSVSRLFSFTGGDIDSTVLAKARNALYTDFSFRGVAPALRQRYFDQNQWGYALKDHVKNRVEFHELNLLAEHFPPALHDFDIIFFRNVSIYFDAPTRKIIQQNLASLLKPDGLLVIGTAETLANDLGVLPLVEEEGLFYFIKGKPPLLEATLSNALPAFNAILEPASELSPLLVPPGNWCLPALVPNETTRETRTETTNADLGQARQLTRDKCYDEALPILNAVLAVDPENTEARLLKAHVQINRRDFSAAEALAQRVLATDAWSIDAFLLLGLAAKWLNQGEAAIRWFKQAAYACHECWPAHYYLADLYRHAGEVELARRAYRVVVQLLAASEGNSNAMNIGIQFIPLDLPSAEVRFLCEHQLAKLPAGKALAGQR